jgi:hypothetical protein
MFAAVGADGNARVMTSYDGITWTPRIPSIDTNYWISIVWISQLGLFLASAYNTNAGSRTMVSRDGITWTTKATLSTDYQWNSVTWSPELNRAVAVSDSAVTGSVMTADGILTNQGGNLAVSGILTSANPWIRGRFTSTAAAAYIPMTLLQGSGISVTNSTFLYAPVAGRYVVGFNSIFNSSSTRCDIHIYLNGTACVNTLSEDTTTGYHYRGASTIIYLYPTDYIQFYVTFGTTYPPTAATGEWSNFYMALIS